MARMTEFQPLYEAFHLFQERCLQQDRSLILAGPTDMDDRQLAALENAGY